MACPFFYPGEPLPQDGQLRQGRFPLGAAHKGLCLAAPGEPFEPGDNILRSFCNFGYGRHSCPRFPVSSDADAVRFSFISRPGEATRLVFVFEREFAPVRHGALLESNTAEQTEACLARQAEVFAANYAPKTRTA